MNNNNEYLLQQFPQNQVVTEERVDDYFGRVLVVGKQEILSSSAETKFS